MLKAELQEAYDALLAERAEFNSRLIKAAGEAAYEHDLCKVLDETLAKVGIDVPTVEVVVESATVYRIPMTVAYRIGLLAEDNDLKEAAESAINYGVLSEDYDDEDFAIPGGVDKDDAVIANVTVRELPPEKVKPGRSRPRELTFADILAA